MVYSLEGQHATVLMILCHGHLFGIYNSKHHRCYLPFLQVVAACAAAELQFQVSEKASVIIACTPCLSIQFVWGLYLICMDVYVCVHCTYVCVYNNVCMYIL